jgi:hypothetical protein
MKNLMIVTAALILPSAAFGSETPSNTNEPTANIASLSDAQCQDALEHLHKIYEQMRYMDETQAKHFLQLIGQDLRKRGLRIPPPPPPCSTPHFALEQRCGNYADAASKCQAKQRTSTSSASSTETSAL